MRMPRRAPALALPCALALLAPGPTRAEPRAPRPDIVLVTLDTTRADHLGAYGYERNTSPSLDRLARDAVVHTRAYSTSSWTLPAHASLFTGRFPTSHGARLDPQGPLVLGSAVTGPGFLRDFRARPLAAGLPTLAERLAEAGYATAAVVAGPWMKRPFGLDRGFQHYDDEEIHRITGRLASQVSDAAIRWLASAPRRPFFLFLNYYDPHGPYTDPEGLARLFLPPEVPVYPPPVPPSPTYRVAAYDAEIRYMDRHLGRLLDHLRERGLYDGAWILVTADHGELLGEQDAWGHGYSLFEGELRVPLIVKAPGAREPAHSAQRIQLSDLTPAILSGLGLPLPAEIQGSAPPGATHPVYAEVYPLGRTRSSWRALYDARFKLLWNSAGGHRLYDLERDPHEQSDLAQREPEQLRALAARLDTLLAGLPAPPPAGDETALDAETREALESLGYLE